MRRFTRRNNRTIVVVAFAAVLGAVAGPAAAQDLAPIFDFLGRLLQKPVSIAELRSNANQHFDSHDLDGGGVGPGDVALRQELAASQLRGRHVSAWAARDLDGDGVVTRAELERFFTPKSREYLRAPGGLLKPTPEQQRIALRQLVDQALLDDENRDGRIELGEVGRDPNSPLGSVPSVYRLADPADALALDLDGDGTVTPTEFKAQLDRLLEIVDENRNLQLDEEEVVALRDVIAAARAQVLRRKIAGRIPQNVPRPGRGCPRLIVPKNARVVFIGGYEGQALSTVQAGGKQSVTTVVDVEVDAGRTPYFLVLNSSASVIWRLTGAVGRVAGLAMENGNDGVIGVSPTLVQTYRARDCGFPDWTTYLSPVDPDGPPLRQLLGRAPDQVVQGYELGLVRLPGGSLGTAARRYLYPGARQAPRFGDAAKVWKDLLRFHPGGIVEIFQGDVVSNSARRYHPVLPQEAGLIQLIEERRLSIVGRHETIPVRDVVATEKGLRYRSREGKTVYSNGGDDLVEDGDWPVRLTGGAPERSFRGAREYLVNGAITAPPGLNGAHSVTFRVPPGTPKPRGEYSSSLSVTLE